VTSSDDSGYPRKSPFVIGLNPGGQVRLGSGSGNGEERKGDEKEGRGQGREGKHDEPKATDARPLAFEGQTASFSIKDENDGNGTPKASSKGILTKEAALEEVARLVSFGVIDLAGASGKLRAFGFTHSEINSPALLQLLKQASST